MSNEIGKQVFTTNGVYVGSVRDITLERNGEKATQLAVGDLNTELFDHIPHGTEGILIPYRWVRATNDVVLIADAIEDVEPSKQTTPSSTSTSKSSSTSKQNTSRGDAPEPERKRDSPAKSD